MTRLSDPVIGHDSSMSSATPAAFWSAMSTITTSASSLSAIQRATVDPTFPAPPTTATFRYIAAPRLHVPDHCVGELGRLQFLRAGHQSRKVVGDLLGGNGAVHALHDEVGGLGPAEMPEHHLARKDHRARVHLVQIRVLGRRA